jgi:FkbM family methyltransferase
MASPLAPLFQESVDEVRQRERNALEDLLNERQRRVVLFGAGTLGKRALVLLREIGGNVLAYSDNNSAAWDTQIENIPVLSPERVAALYGNSALFLVTIWNDHHWFSETFAQLSGLGCTLISSYAPLYWRFPDTFMQLLLLNEPPHRLYLQAEAVLRAEGVWADQESLNAYRSNIRWRAVGDARDLPGRPRLNTYFPAELFTLNGSDSLLDCGAFDGDTIRQALECSDSSIRAVYAIEADSLSFARLQGFVKSLGAEISQRIRTFNCAVGLERGFVRFECSGSLTSKVSVEGSLVELFPLDEIFADTPVTMIKMDIEGAEYDALRGAAKIIRRDQPILAICVYHTQNDIWRIPLLVHEMLPEHRFYLRAYEGDGFQTVMYAVPSNRILQKN